MGNCFGCCLNEHEISISSPSSSYSNGHGYDGKDDFPPFLKPTPWQQQYSPPHLNPPKPELGPILNKPYVNITDYYELQKELGKGQFGVTYRCVEKSTGLLYACKSIPMLKLRRKKDIDDVRREILILEHLSGQPNIVEFKGAYEDRNFLYMVMELCSGGELFDRIVSKKSYSEKEAAGLFRQIMNVVHVCHFMGVMHRDLKPENFLMVSPADDSPLKIIDFGLSVFIEQGRVYTQVVGSSYYIAPEVLLHRYGKEIDVWSAGIILYILLCGFPPFWAETDEDIFKEILNGKLDLQSDPWPKVSAPAKDLIKKLLTRDPRKRISAADALEHPWLKEGGEASAVPIDNAVLTRMTHFRDMNKLKKLAIKVMAENVSSEEIKGLREMFDNIDTDKSGTITIEELRDGLARLGSRLHESELQELMDAADLDKNGTIDINEFITATMNRHRLEKEENLLKAFKFFDIDNSGYITRDELKKVMTDYNMGDEATIDEVLEDVDADKDGRIDYNEFVEMMKKGAAVDQGFELLVQSDKSPSGGPKREEDYKETSLITEHNKPGRVNDISPTQPSHSQQPSRVNDISPTQPSHSQQPTRVNDMSPTQPSHSQPQPASI